MKIVRTEKNEKLHVTIPFLKSHIEYNSAVDETTKRLFTRKILLEHLIFLYRSFDVSIFFYSFGFRTRSISRNSRETFPRFVLATATLINRFEMPTKYPSRSWSPCHGVRSDLRGKILLSQTNWSITKRQKLRPTVETCCRMLACATPLIRIFFRSILANSRYNNIYVIPLR